MQKWTDFYRNSNKKLLHFFVSSGKDDSKIKEKYPVLAWIDEYMEAKKESDIMRARQEENGELDSLYDDEEILGCQVTLKVK